MQCNQIQWTQWCHPSIAKAIETTQAVNTINHTNPINLPKQAKQWHSSYQTNQVNQPNQSNRACRHLILQQNKSHELDCMQLITLGCRSLPWMGFACVAWLSSWSWVGLAIGLYLIPFGYIGLCLICFQWLWFDSLMCFMSCANISLDLIWFSIG